MAVSVKFVQLIRKKKKNGEVPIYMQIIENRKARYLSTGISIHEKFWNEKTQEVRKTHKLYKRYNSELFDLKVKIEQEKSELRQDGHLDSQKLQKKLKSNNKKSVVEYAEFYREQLIEDDRFWEQKHIGVIINDFKDAGYSFYNMSNVDTAFIDEFSRYLKNEKGNSVNTIRKKIQRFRGMVNHAIKEDVILENPFQFYEMPKRKVTSKTKLSPNQITAIEELNLEKGSRLWHIRNYFLFSFYLAGIRFSDLCTLEPKNLVDGRLKYKMKKTGGEKNIKIFEQAQRILEFYNTTEEGYIFPIIDFEIKESFDIKKKISGKNVVVNRALKQIAKLAGIKESVSFHVSRHSFAHYALTKGVNVYSISKALGHSDLKTTEVYLKAFDEELLDKEMDKLF